MGENCVINVKKACLLLENGELLDSCLSWQILSVNKPHYFSSVILYLIFFLLIYPFIESKCTTREWGFFDALQCRKIMPETSGKGLPTYFATSGDTSEQLCRETHLRGTANVHRQFIFPDVVFRDVFYSPAYPLGSTDVVLATGDSASGNDPPTQFVCVENKPFSLRMFYVGNSFYFFKILLLLLKFCFFVFFCFLCNLN